MKKSLVFVLSVIVALSGCKRSEFSVDNPTSERRISAEATLGEGLKSHFGPDGYNLVWDSTDNLLVYSNYMGGWDGYQDLISQILTEYNITNPTEKDIDDAGVIAYFRLLRDNAAQRYAGTFSIAPGGVGKATAEFFSNGTASTWMAEGGDEDLYYFLAFYPAPSVIPEIKSYYFTELAGTSDISAEAPFPYMDITIQPEQDGVNYQDYQLLMGGPDAPNVKGDVLAGEKLQFDGFMPVTSILEFTMQTSEGTAEIDHLDITLSTQEEAGAEYVSNKYMVAGTLPLFFSWDETNEMRLWNRACQPFMSGFGSSWENEHNAFDVDAWSGLGSDATSTLRLQFASPVSINDSPSEQKFYAVMAPARCVHISGCGNPRLTFDAYNAAGEKILTKTITTTSPQGIEEGKKYAFALELGAEDSSDELALPGEYSVSPTKKVKFARGNLVYEAGSWNFRSNQSDRSFATDGSVTISASSHFDLFGWATAGVKNSAGEYGATSSHTAYQPWSVSTDYEEYGPSTADLPGGTPWNGTVYEPFCDWGQNPDLVTALGSGWRTLTDEEWHYLLFERPCTTVNGVENARFVYGNLGVSNGIFIFPDNFPMSSVSVFGSHINDAAQGSYSDFMMGSEWMILEGQYGMVFLSASGLRDGSSVYEISALGAYWSSTPAQDSADAYTFYFVPGDDVRTGYRFQRNIGLPVRLVKDVTNP